MVGLHLFLLPATAAPIMPFQSHEQVVHRSVAGRAPACQYHGADTEHDDHKAHKEDHLVLSGLARYSAERSQQDHAESDSINVPSPGIVSLHIIHIPAVAGSPVREDQARHPVSNYGRSKLAGQCLAEAHMDRLPIVMLLPPAVYGPNDRSFLGLYACVKRGVVPVIGREARWVSLLYAEDLARAVVACLQNGKAAGRAYLLEDGTPHTWREVMAAIGRAMHASYRQVRVPLLAARLAGTVIGCAARCMGKTPWVDRDRIADFLQPSWTCSGAKIGAELDFVPRYNLEQGAAETGRWYKEHQWL
jgi:nucleoside-diphosphate-sugar epimerase